ncbi:MAG: helicase [Chloroflexota bacterium]|nr:helicase [Chloroflexota bacterium]
MSFEDKKARLYYHRLPDFDRKESKLEFLSENSLSTVDWQRLVPNTKHTWRRSDTEDEFDSYLLIGSKEAKRAKPDQAETIFKTYSGGVKTNRDMYVYDYQFDSLAKRMRRFVDDYNSQVDKYKRMNPKPAIDDFVDYENVAWSRDLKLDLKRGNYAIYAGDKIRNSLYRPFAKRYLFLDRVLNEEVYQQPTYFPTESVEFENRLICCTDVAYRSQTVSALMLNCIPCLSVCSTTDSHQCFPFYTYNEDGSNRRENITDWALSKFRSHYHDPAIAKWDIFYYVYGLLHHPGYRERYALDLKRNLPRIPFALEFRPYTDAGRQLADLHLNYESADRYELDWQSTRKPVSYRVEKMLPKGKVDSAEGSYKVYSALKYNDTLILRDIPERAFAYRLGNRSALDWIVDQYRVKTDKRSGITHDPNGYSDDPQYILKLIERVITVSLHTVDIVERLAALPFRAHSD